MAAAQPSTRRSAVGRKAVNSLDVLKEFLQAHIQKVDPEIDEATTFSYAFVDLNADGKDEAIVHVTGRTWCGTGGCLTYVLSQREHV